jgi:hypothetical protein
MVGVARIELATPAMSRQGHWRFSAYFGGFSCSACAIRAGTDGESRAILPHFYRASSRMIAAQDELPSTTSTERIVPVGEEKLKACENADIPIWHEPDGAIIQTAGGGIGINCGGLVIVKPLREWHALASRTPSLDREVVDQWQPIETFAEPTAPSTGNGVIIADADGTVGEAYFRNHGDSDDGWWWVNTSWGDCPEPERPTSPTHWRPLPAPPALSALQQNNGGGS